MSATADIPSLDKTESIVVIVLFGLAAYVVYEMYSASKSIPSAVTATAKKVQDAVMAVVNAPSNAANAATSAVTGVKDDTLGGAIYSATHPDPVAVMSAADDQSQAETARLIAQNGGQVPEGSAPSWMFAPNLGLDNGSVTSGNTISAADASPSPTAIDGLSGNW